MTFNFKSELERQKYVEESISSLIDFLNRLEPALRYEKEKTVHSELVQVLAKHDLVTIIDNTLPANVISMQEFIKNKHTH